MDNNQLYAIIITSIIALAIGTYLVSQMFGKLAQPPPPPPPAPEINESELSKEALMNIIDIGRPSMSEEEIV